MAYVDGLCTGTIGTSAGAGISVGWKDEDDGCFCGVGCGGRI